MLAASLHAHVIRAPPGHHMAPAARAWAAAVRPVVITATLLEAHWRVEEARKRKVVGLGLGVRAISKGSSNAGLEFRNRQRGPRRRIRAMLMRLLMERTEVQAVT